MISGYFKYFNPSLVEDNKIFCHFNKLDLTYKQLNKDINDTVLLFNENNLGNKNIGIIATPDYFFFVSVIAAWKINSTVVLLSPFFTQNEIFKICRHCDVSYLINPFFYLQTDFVKQIYNDIKDRKSPDTALIILTSGSTDTPKAVCHSFFSLYHSILISNSLIGYSSSDQWILSLSPAHIGGFSIFLRSLFSHIPLIIPKSQKAECLAETICESPGAMISLVPAMLENMISQNLDLTTLKYIFLGGSASSDSLLDKIIKLKLPVVKVYGSSETAAMISAVNISQYPEFKLSSGFVSDNIEIQITDDKEIQIKSSSLFVEYYNNPELTQKRLVDGFYKTGDIGTFVNNVLFISGRKDNIIISSGLKINPQEIQNYILNFEGIADTVVFSIPDQKIGEKLVCAVIPASISFSTEQLINFLKEKISSYKIPKEIFIVDNFPTLASGKPDIFQLKKHLFNKT